MKFWEAMRALEEGKRFKRKDYRGYIFSEGGEILAGDNHLHYIAKLEDFEATDWVEIS